MSWLAIRQVQAGERKHSTVLRHLSSLTQVAPSHFDFSFRAGNWALEPQLMKVPEAIKFYHNCLYGKASYYISNTINQADTSSNKTQNSKKKKESKENSSDNKVKPRDEDIYLARREYARALALDGQGDEAIAELVKLLSNNVIDFGAVFRLRSLVNNINRNNDTNDIEHKARIILSNYDTIYSDILSVSSNNYTGFIPSNNWKPERLTTLPSVSTFNDYVQRREPMIISLGSWLDYSLGWKTSKWGTTDKKKDDKSGYLLNLLASDMVLVELVNNSNSRNSKSINAIDTNNNSSSSSKVLFGFGSEAQRKIISFKSFMESYERNSVELKDYLVYLNIQGSDPKNGDVYKSPLNKLKDDIPTPGFLKDAWTNMTAVNLWMGNSYEGTTTSRLHMDAMDNLYVVLKGTKDFVVYPPNLSNYMRTISPTISVSPNGHSFQYKGPIDNENKNSNLETKKNHNYLKDKTYIDYDKEKYHFSYLSGTDDPLLEEALGKEKRFSLKPGDILYLPAGWFHQVTSSEGQHQALNYWWKPPGWNTAVKFEKKATKNININLNKLANNNINNHHIEL